MNIKEYIKEATSKIFGIKEKESVSLELTDHILCKQEFYEDIGYEQEISEEKAVDEMGSGEEIADYLGSIHNDFYNPVFDIIGFVVWAFLLAGSYLLMRRLVLNDATAVPVSIGYAFGIISIYFGFSAINVKRNRKVPAVLTFIIGAAIAVLVFFVNAFVNLCGVGSVSKLKALMFDGIIPQSASVSLVPLAVISGIIFLIAVAVLSVSLFFVKKYEMQENTLKTNRARKSFSKLLTASCVLSLVMCALFAGDIVIIQSQIEKQYTADYNTVFEIVENCENRQQVEEYIKEKGYEHSYLNNNEIVINGHVSNIRLDFSEMKQEELDDPWARLFGKIVLGYLGEMYPQSLEKQFDYIITLDVSEKFSIANGFEKGCDSIGLAKIKTQPRDLDNLFDFQTKDNTTNEEMLETFGMYYPKKITVYASNNHKTHSSSIEFEYPAGEYEFSYVESFTETLECENAVKVNEQKKLVLDTLNGNPQISNEELAKTVGAKHKQPDISLDDYKSMIKYVLGNDVYRNVSDAEIRKAYAQLECFEFSDDLIFYRFAGIENYFVSQLPEDEIIDMVIFNSRTNVNYVSFEKYGDAAEKTEGRYVSQYGGMFRKTVCTNVGYYDIHGKAYLSEQDVAYYSKDGERFRYYQELDDEGKLIEQYFIGSKGSKCIANNGYVGTDGYFVCGNDEFKKDYYNSESSIDRYHDAQGNEYMKACEVSWDSNGDLLDFDEYFNASY